MQTIFLTDPPRLARVEELPEGTLALPPERVAEIEAGLAAGQVLFDDGGQPALRDPFWWWSAATGGFYREGIHAVDALPQDALQISEADHDALLAGQSDGKRIVAGNGGVPVLQDPPPLSLEEVKRRALVAIDREAEASRGAFLTPGSGQALEYQATLGEALAFASDPAPDPEAYPMLVAEQQALASVGVISSLAVVAETVRQQSAEWNAVGAAIKATRRAAKLQVEAAADAETVAGILSALTWPNL